MGWVFLWAFVDKVFGLGFETCRDSATQAINVLCEQAWLSGGSPTFGFLRYGTKGPFQEFFASLAGNPIIDWLFMLGLLGVGITLLSGRWVKWGAYIGVLMLAFMYVAGFIWPQHNPFLDEHLVYAVIMLGLAGRFR